MCVGALLLAAAGLLDGCKATTHWGAITALQLFPEIEVVPGYPRFVVDHQGDSLRITGAGVSAGIDEALEIVSIFAGGETAKSVQLLLQYAPKPPFIDADPNSASPQIYDAVWRAARPLERKRIEQIQQMLSHQPTSAPR